jgi:mannose-6-phosphate isomerase
LHIDNGVAVANAWPLRSPANPTRHTDERTVLVAIRHFVLERVDLQAASSWALVAEPETWVLVLDGHAAIGLATVSTGQAVFVGGGRSSIEVGTNGLTALIAYPASRPIVSLLQRLCEPSTQPGQPTALDDPKWAALAEAHR